MLNIVVCLKAIPDPDVPASDLRIDAAARRATGGSYVISPFDENGLELALQLREQAGGGRITVLSAGGPEATDRLRKALAVGADAAVRVEPTAEPDPFAVATLLAGAVRKAGDVQVVLTGRQAGDWDHGQVGGLLAELLGFSYVPFASKIAPAGDDRLQITRETASGSATVLAPMPVVITATNDAGCQLRLPKIKDLMAARKMAIAEWLADSVHPRTRLRLLRPPVEANRACEILSGADAAAQAEVLADWLRERGLVRGGAGR